MDEEYPKAALELIQQQHLNGRIFNQYKWGGYMEWHAPEVKTFVDGRADIFVYNGVFEDFLRATSLKRSFEILDKYKIDYVFLQPNEPLVYLLEHTPGWRPTYSDKIAVLLERTPAAAALSKTQPN